MSDLVVLTADNDMEFTLRAALSRHKALNIREITAEFYKHANRDPGVRCQGADLLKTFNRKCSHALMCLDLEGSGAEDQTAEELEAELDRKLQLHWGQSAKAIVIEPELEILMWGSDTKMAQELEWSEPMAIREWLISNGYALRNDKKPVQPKDAFQAVLRKLQLPKSASIYAKLAKRMSIPNCKDKSLYRLQAALAEWFPLES